MLPNDLYQAQILVHRDGKTSRYGAGRFLVANGVLHHLEDYHGLLSQKIPEGPVDDMTIHQINHCGPDLAVASHGEIRGGRRLDFIPEAQLKPLPKENPVGAPGAPSGQLAQPPQPQPPSVWHYTRAGHDAPHVLEAREGHYLLDGNPLEDREVAAILDNVRSGAGKIRYTNTVGGVRGKVSAMEKALRKADRLEDAFADEYDSLPEGPQVAGEMDPQDALAHLDQLGGDEKTSAAIAALRRHVFEDPMTPGVGNQYAWQQFRKKNVPGVYASIDVNDLKHLNDTQGHPAGDALIRAFGSAARTAANPAATKLFRSGGDEYVLHAPDAETAYQTIRGIRGNLEKVPPIAGVHKPSFSVGVGPSYEHADKALYMAKDRKYVPGTQNKVRAHAPGSVPNLAHSLMPGHEGPIPLDSPSVVGPHPTGAPPIPSQAAPKA